MQMYPIQEVLLLVTCATTGAYDDIVAWGEHHLAFLRRVGDFHHGVPCARRLRDMMNRVDPALIAACFEAWVGDLWPGRREGMHWLLNVEFKDDLSRYRQGHGHGAKNMAALSPFALDLVRNHKSKGSVKTSRKRATWSPNFLLSILHVP
jgi:hypothetical protein